MRIAGEELTNDNEESPTVKEIADDLEVAEEDILETMEMGRSYKALSVDRKIEADSDGSTVAMLELVGNNEDGFDNMDHKMLVEEMLPVLSEREQHVLKYWYVTTISHKERV